MKNKLPEVSEGQEKIWAALFSVIKNTAEPVYALLEVGPIKDDIFQGLAMDEQGHMKKIADHSADRFVLYVKSGKNGKQYSNYFGNGERIRDEQSRTGFGYSPETMKELRHEVGLRLSRLYGLERSVHFTSELLGAQEQEVTEEFISGLLSSERKELGFIAIKISED